MVASAEHAAGEILGIPERQLTMRRDCGVTIFLHRTGFVELVDSSAAACNTYLYYRGCAMPMTVRLSARTERAVNALARRRRQTRSDVVRDALEHYTATNGGDAG